MEGSRAAGREILAGSSSNWARKDVRKPSGLGRESGWVAETVFTEGSALVKKEGRLAVSGKELGEDKEAATLGDSSLLAGSLKAKVVDNRFRRYMWNRLRNTLISILKIRNIGKLSLIETRSHILKIYVRPAGASKCG